VTAFSAPICITRIVIEGFVRPGPAGTRFKSIAPSCRSYSKAIATERKEGGNPRDATEMEYESGGTPLGWTGLNTAWPMSCGTGLQPLPWLAWHHSNKNLTAGVLQR
jgi:hypothetical protein